MGWRCASECLILSASRRFIADQIRIGAAQSGRPYGFVGIDHYVMPGGFGNGIEIVVYEPLAVVMFPEGKDVSDIAALYRIITISVHELVCLFHMPFIVPCGGRGLMVHEKFHPFGMGIVVEGLDVEIRIWRNEIEDIVFIAVRPVFPAFIPSFHENLVETVLCGKINISSDIGIVCGMSPVRGAPGIVCLSEFYRREVIGIVPGAFPGNHLPPYPDIFNRMNPRDILKGAGFVEVEYHPRCKLSCCARGHLNGPPWRFARGLHTAFPSLRIRSQMRGESEGGRVQVQMHAGIVDESGLVDVYVQSLVRAELEGGLHAVYGERGLGIIAGEGLFEML